MEHSGFTDTMGGEERSGIRETYLLVVNWIFQTLKFTYLYHSTPSFYFFASPFGFPPFFHSLSTSPAPDITWAAPWKVLQCCHLQSSNQARPYWLPALLLVLSFLTLRNAGVFFPHVPKLYYASVMHTV